MTEGEAWLAKLDPALRRLLQSAGSSAAEEWVSLLLQVSGPIDDLASQGLVFGSQAGDVLLAQAPLSAVPRIARHPSIIQIEASHGLHADR